MSQSFNTIPIETIPGIGETLGPVFLGIIGNSERFSSQSKARGYSGMIPRQKDSGESSKKGLNITKDGPSRYRPLYLASDTGRQWDPQLAKVYYDQMVHKGNCHNQAVCAVSTHLIGRIIRVLKDKRPYERRDLEGKPITKREAKILLSSIHVKPFAQFRHPEPLRLYNRLQKVFSRPRRHGAFRCCRNQNNPPIYHTSSEIMAGQISPYCIVQFLGRCSRLLHLASFSRNFCHDWFLSWRETSA